MERVDARRLLEVDVGAGRDEIEAAFRRQVRDAHPDRGGDRAHFELLVEARHVLVDPGAPQGSVAPVVGVQAVGFTRQILSLLLRRLRSNGGDSGPRRVV